MDLNFKKGEFLPRPLEPKSEAEIVSGWAGDPSTPLVSILCHTYNHEGFLRDALNSFLMQETSFPFEIIVNDDASTDETRVILSQYKEKYPKIIKLILHSDNQYSRGKKPLSFTYPEAKGKYVAICEGDDYWLDKNKIQFQFDLLENDKNLVVCYHDTVSVDNNNKYIGATKVNKKGYSSERMAESPFIPTLTRFFRRVELEWLHLNGLPVAMDFVLTSYLSRYGGAGYVEGVLPGVYRLHEGGVWSLQSNLYQKRNAVDAMLFLAHRYDIEGNSRLRRFFVAKAMKEISKFIDFRSFMKIFLKFAFASLKNCIFPRRKK